MWPSKLDLAIWPNSENWSEKGHSRLLFQPLHTHTHTRTHACIHACTHMQARMYTHAHTGTYTRTNTKILYIYIDII